MQGVGCPDGVGPRGYLSAGAGESNPHGGTRRLAYIFCDSIYCDIHAGPHETTTMHEWDT
jgi:hypothetical protein